LNSKTLSYFLSVSSQLFIKLLLLTVILLLIKLDINITIGILNIYYYNIALKATNVME